MIIPEWLFQDLSENIPGKNYNPESLKQIARENNKEYETELAKRCLIHITSLMEQYKRDLIKNYHHDISKLTNETNFLELGIETRFNNKLLKAITINYARLLNQYKFKYQTVFLW